MKPCLAALTAGCLALGGCASFDGIQEPVIASDVAVRTALGEYGLAKSLAAIADKADDQKKRSYRNQVISIWMLAIDTRYDAFRRDLSRGRKGSNVGLDFVTLGLTSAGAIWDGAASELSALATGVGGARASLDRELYFEKTLPVLISYMDAERLRLRGAIMEGMSQPIGDYSLEQGFADLWRYQSAGSLDRAIGKAAEGAAAQIEEAEYDYSEAIGLCLPSAELAERRAAIQRRFNAGFQRGTNRFTGSAEQKAAKVAQFNRGAALGGVGPIPADASDAAIMQQGNEALKELRVRCTEEAIAQYEAAVFGEDE